MTPFERLLTCRPVNKMAALHVCAPSPAPDSSVDFEAQAAIKEKLIVEYRKKFFKNGQPTCVLLDLMRRNANLRKAGKPEEPLPHLDPLGFHATCVARKAHHEEKFIQHVANVRRESSRGRRDHIGAC